MVWFGFVTGVTCQIQERISHTARFFIFCDLFWYAGCTMVVITFVVDNAVRITKRNFLATERLKSELMRLSLLIKPSTWHTISSVSDVFGFPLHCFSSHPVLPLSTPHPQLWPWYYACIVLSNLAVRQPSHAEIELALHMALSDQDSRTNSICKLPAWQ
jgi:hypothetical protein